MANMHTADTVFELLSLNVEFNTHGTMGYSNSLGQWHRIHGPALIFPSGTKYWYQNGQLHRTDGPAALYARGDHVWYYDGAPHRLDGPAVELADGGVEYWIGGVSFTEDEFTTARVMLSLKFVLALVGTACTR